MSLQPRLHRKALSQKTDKKTVALKSSVCIFSPVNFGGFQNNPYFKGFRLNSLPSLISSIAVNVIVIIVVIIAVYTCMYRHEHR